MIERSRGPSFSQESTTGFGVGQFLGCNKLDLDLTPQTEVFRKIDLSHAATPEKGEQSISIPDP